MNVSMKKMIYDRLTGRETSLAVIGLGYVGVPVALRFARCFDVVGYDMDARRIEKLREKYGAGCGHPFHLFGRGVVAGRILYRHGAHPGR